MKRTTLLALLLVPLPSFATPVLWTLDGSILQGGTASGSFIYDADTSTFSDIHLRTTGSPSGGLEFTQFASEVQSDGLNFLQAGASGYDPTVAFQLNGVYLSQLTNLGGEVLVNPNTFINFFAEFSCGYDGRLCGEGGGGFVSNWSAQSLNRLTGTPTQVPEPGTLALMGVAGFLGFAIRRRRRERVQGPLVAGPMSTAQ